MKYLAIILIFTIKPQVFADADLNLFIQKKWKINKTQQEYLMQGKILSKSRVVSPGKKQDFKLNVMALQKVKCSKILRKISMLENYAQWISFIKKSTYSEENKLFTIRANHTLLPYPMLVHILVARPTTPGYYPFMFPTGMFHGMAGHYEIKEFNKKCIFFAESHWNGPATKIPNFVVELFSETLSQMGGEILLRKAK
jgi:hypothetical protein